VRYQFTLSQKVAAERTKREGQYDRKLKDIDFPFLSFLETAVIIKIKIKEIRSLAIDPEDKNSGIKRLLLTLIGMTVYVKS
jgi:hypothetical protein